MKHKVVLGQVRYPRPAELIYMRAREQKRLMEIALRGGRQDLTTVHPPIHRLFIRRPLTRINAITKSLTWIRVYSGNDRLTSEFGEQEITWPAGCGLENMFKRACG